MVPWPPRKQECLIASSVNLLCGERTCETYKTIDAQYLAGTNKPRDFKSARVVRSRYLVLLYICYVLLNIRDKNPLYGTTTL